MEFSPLASGDGENSCMKGRWDVWLQCLLNVSETLPQTNTNSCFIYCISCCINFILMVKGSCTRISHGKTNLIMMKFYWNKAKQSIKHTASLEVSFSTKHAQTHLKTEGCLQFGFWAVALCFLLISLCLCWPLIFGIFSIPAICWSLIYPAAPQQLKPNRLQLQLFFSLRQSPQAQRQSEKSFF